MGRFKEGPPEVAPHVVVEKLADVAHFFGYQIQYGFTLGYWHEGQEYVITMPALDYIERGPLGKT